MSRLPFQHGGTPANRRKKDRKRFLGRIQHERNRIERIAFWGIANNGTSDDDATQAFSFPSSIEIGHYLFFFTPSYDFSHSHS